MGVLEGVGGYSCASSPILATPLREWDGGLECVEGGGGGLEDVEGGGGRLEGVRCVCERCVREYVRVWVRG